jgi:hypothetical protein
MVRERERERERERVIFTSMNAVLCFSYSVTDRAIEPLKAQLADLDRAIADQLDLIAASKSNILRNDNRIQKMLHSIARS